MVCQDGKTMSASLEQKTNQFVRAGVENPAAHKIIKGVKLK
jgi:hypothetical protein